MTNVFVAISEHTDVYQLNKVWHDDGIQKKLKSVLDEWRKDRACKVWISDSLLMDLNEPFHPKQPRVTQAFFLGEGLPAFVLTVYDKHSLDKDSQHAQSGPQTSHDEFHMLTVSTVKLLTTSLLDFCHCHFAILPCTLDTETLHVESFRKELEERMLGCQQFYDGDLYLMATTYRTLVSAAKALQGASYLPCFLNTQIPVVGSFSYVLIGRSFMF